MRYGIKKLSLNLRSWGCHAFIKRLKSEKFEVKTVSESFIKYLKKILGNYFYIQFDQKVVVNRNVKFLEKSLFKKVNKEEN